MKFTKTLLALGLFAAAGGAFAQTQTGNLAVTTSIAGSCSLTTVAVAFTPYSGTQLTANGSVSLACTQGSGQQITLGNGQYYDGTGATRRMRTGVVGNYSYLNYALFQPTDTQPVPNSVCAYTTLWEGATALAIGAAPSNAARTYNICGRMPASQTGPAGNYADQVVVTATL